MKILEDYNKFAFELLIEDDEASGRIDMDEPLMQKKGWYKDNPELTIGGVLKQGEKHPAYKDAMQIVDKEKGKDSGEDDSNKLSGKSDFSRDGGDDKPKADKPKGDDEYEPDKENADDAKKEFASISTDLDLYDGDLPKSIKRRVDNHTQDIMAQQGIYKNDDGKFATDDGKVLSSDSVHKMLSKETGRTENEVANLLDRAGLSPGDEPKAKDKSGGTGDYPDHGDDGNETTGGGSSFSTSDLESTPFNDDIENEVSDELTGHYSDGYQDEEKADIVRDEAEKLSAKYQSPMLPNHKNNMKDYRDELVKNIEKRLGESKKSKKPFLKEQLERIGGLK